MAFPKRLEDFRIIFFRSLYPPNKPSAAGGKDKDERLLKVFDLLTKAGLDTEYSKVNLPPSKTNLSGQGAIDHLEFVLQLKGFPCVLLIWTKQEKEEDVLGFCGRLMKAYPDPLGDAPLIWFRESPGETYTRFNGPDGAPLHLLTMPYRLAYTDADIVTLKNFLMFRKPTSSVFKAVRPIHTVTLSPSSPDATVKSQAFDESRFNEILAARARKKTDV